MKKTNLILIPMAGIGKRFKEANFNTLKPLVLVDNESILEKSIKNLPTSKNKYIILNKNVFEKKKILRKILSKNKFKNFLIKNKTLGQADTINRIKFLFKDTDLEKDCLIHSCDYILKYNFNKFSKIAKESDVIVFVSKLKSKIINDYNSFAYCKMRNQNEVKKIVEKTTISKFPENDYVVVGSFWFKKLSDCFLSQDISLKKNNTVNNEYYIGNNLNNLINLGKKVVIQEVDTWINLGDIFSYSEYIYWKNFFERNKDIKKC